MLTVSNNNMCDPRPISGNYLQNKTTRSAVSALTQHYPHCDGSRGHPGQVKLQMLPHAPSYYPIPRGKAILGVIYGVLLWG